MRYLTAGESHGSELTIIISDVPSGIKIDNDFIQNEMRRRQSGYGRGKRMQIETDNVVITAGVRFGKTTGAPVSLKIQNRDWENWIEKMSVFKKYSIPKLTMPRPGHADFAGLMKYDEDDIRNILERSSARETASQVAAGAFCKNVLRDFNIEILSHTIAIGNIFISKKYSADDLRNIYNDEILRCIDKLSEKKMIDLIEKIKSEGDTLGGIFEVMILNCIPGLGSYSQSDMKIDSKLAAAVMSIQGVKGIEFGAGFNGVKNRGSQFHDEFGLSEKKIIRTSNNAGGIEGGMTNGMPIVFRAAMKPIPTLMKALQSVDLSDLTLNKAIVERSDVCVVPAAGVAAEAFSAITIFNQILIEFGADSIKFIKQKYFDKLKYLQKKYHI